MTEYALLGVLFGFGVPIILYAIMLISLTEIEQKRLTISGGAWSSGRDILNVKA